MAVVPSWVETHCIIPDGFRQGAPFQLYDYQLRYLANFYLVRGDARWVPENPVLSPAFVYRRGLLVGPHKMGKDPLIASQICVEGVGPALFGGWAGPDEGYVCAEYGCQCGWEYPYDPGEPKGMRWRTPLIQITAFSGEATDNTYGALRPMIDLGPLTDMIPKTGEAFIRLPDGGRIDTVTSSAQSRLGNPITHASQGELGIWTAQNKMTKLAETQYRGLAGMGGRASATTNAWDPAEQSVAQQMYTSAATDIYRQFIRPPKNLSYANKRDRRRIHQIVYPLDVRKEGGGHVDLDSIEAEAADLAERDLPQAARFFGNILVPGAGHAVDSEHWATLKRIREIADGTYVGLGFDGSIYHDTTFLQACTADGYSFNVGKWIRPSGSAMLRWQQEHPGQEWSVPRSEVQERVRWAREHLRVGRFFYDPPKWWTEGEQWADDFGENILGDPVVLMFDTNQPRRMAPAVDRWRTAIVEGTHTHDGDPDTSAHVAAAHLRKVRLADQDDDQTMYVVIKGPDRLPIDGAIADILAYAAAMTMPEYEAVREITAADLDLSYLPI